MSDPLTSAAITAGAGPAGAQIAQAQPQFQPSDAVLFNSMMHRQGVASQATNSSATPLSAITEAFSKQFASPGAMSHADALKRIDFSDPVRSQFEAAALVGHQMEALNKLHLCTSLASSCVGFGQTMLRNAS